VRTYRYVGTDSHREVPVVNVGDKVQYLKHTGTILEVKQGPFHGWIKVKVTSKTTHNPIQQWPADAVQPCGA
jgi:hypothetical protein